jgi:hypothetical protein
MVIDSNVLEAEEMRERALMRQKDIPRTEVNSRPTKYRRFLDPMQQFVQTQ